MKTQLGIFQNIAVFPKLSNYVRDELVQNNIQKINFPVPFLERYVDGILTAVPKLESKSSQ